MKEPGKPGGNTQNHTYSVHDRIWLDGPDGNRGFGYSEPLPDVPPGPEAYENKE